MEAPFIGKRSNLIEAFALVNAQPELRNVCPAQMANVCVAGDQSSGKSAIITRLVGMPIKSSKDLCTRAPMMLTVLSKEREPGKDVMVSTDISFPEAKTFCSSVEDVGKFQEATEACQNELLSNTPMPISDKKIFVRITVPNGNSFSLVDLPGITSRAKDNAGKVTEVGGLTKQITESELAKENTLCIAVLKANNDLYNSCGLTLAMQKCAPSNVIAVITHVDQLPADDLAALVDKVRHATDPCNKSANVLPQSVFLLNNGGPSFEKASAAECDKNEQKFFRQDVFRAIHQYCGLVNLREFISKKQQENALRHLSTLTNILQNEFSCTAHEIELHGPSLDTPEAKSKKVDDITKRVTDNFKVTVMGGSLQHVKLMNSSYNTPLGVTALIEVYLENLVENTRSPYVNNNFLQEDVAHELQTVMQCMKGTKMSVFHNDGAAQEVYIGRTKNIFETVAHEAIKEVTDLVRFTFGEIAKEVCGVDQNELINKLQEHVNKVLETTQKDLTTWVKQLVGYETERMVTYDPLMPKSVKELKDYVQTHAHSSQIYPESSHDEENLLHNVNDKQETINSFPEAFLDKMLECAHDDQANNVLELQAIMHRCYGAAANRFYDIVCVSISSELKSGICSKVHDLLVNHEVKEHLKSSVHETPERKAELERLIKKREMLASCIDKISLVNSPAKTEEFQRAHNSFVRQHSTKEEKKKTHHRTPTTEDKFVRATIEDCSVPYAKSNNLPDAPATQDEDSADSTHAKNDGTLSPPTGISTVYTPHANHGKANNGWLGQSMERIKQRKPLMKNGRVFVAKQR